MDRQHLASDGLAYTLLVVSMSAADFLLDIVSPVVCPVAIIAASSEKTYHIDALGRFQSHEPVLEHIPQHGSNHQPLPLP